MIRQHGALWQHPYWRTAHGLPNTNCMYIKKQLAETEPLGRRLVHQSTVIKCRPPRKRLSTVVSSPTPAPMRLCAERITVELNIGLIL